MCHITECHVMALSSILLCSFTLLISFRCLYWVSVLFKLHLRLSPGADGLRLSSLEASINLTVGNATTSLGWYSCIAKSHFWYNFCWLVWWLVVHPKPSINLTVGTVAHTWSVTHSLIWAHLACLVPPNNSISFGTVC